jgi:hypothetical protein
LLPNALSVDVVELWDKSSVEGIGYLTIIGSAFKSCVWWNAQFKEYIAAKDCLENYGAEAQKHYNEFDTLLEVKKDGTEDPAFSFDTIATLANACTFLQTRDHMFPMGYLDRMGDRFKVALVRQQEWVIRNLPSVDVGVRASHMDALQKLLSDASLVFSSDERVLRLVEEAGETRGQMNGEKALLSLTSKWQIAETAGVGTLDVEGIQGLRDCIKDCAQVHRSGSSFLEMATSIYKNSVSCLVASVASGSGGAWGKALFGMCGELVQIIKRNGVSSLAEQHTKLEELDAAFEIYSGSEAADDPATYDEFFKNLSCNNFRLFSSLASLRKKLVGFNPIEGQWYDAGLQDAIDNYVEKATIVVGKVSDTRKESCLSALAKAVEALEPMIYFGEAEKNVWRHGLDSKATLGACYERATVTMFKTDAPALQASIQALQKAGCNSMCKAPSCT